MRKFLVILALLPLPALAQTPPPVTAPPTTEKTVKLSDDDISYAVKMFDVCAKAQGLGCSEPAVNLSRKLCAAAPALAVCEPFKR